MEDWQIAVVSNLLVLVVLHFLFFELILSKSYNWFNHVVKLTEKAKVEMKRSSVRSFLPC